MALPRFVTAEVNGAARVIDLFDAAGGVPDPGPFDVLSFDFDANTGPRGVTTDTIDSTIDSANRIYIESGTYSNVLFDYGIDTGGVSGDGAYPSKYAYYVKTNTTLLDCEFHIPLINNKVIPQNVEYATLNLMEHCLFQFGLKPQLHTGSRTGAICCPGTYRYCEIVAPIDGMQPANKPTVIEYCWLHSWGFPLYYGNTTAGVPMTPVQAGAIISRSDGLVVTAGQFIAAAYSGDNYAVEVTGSGTLGTGTSGWPTVQGATFTSGTATLRLVGAQTHSDGVQPGSFTTVRRSLIEGYNNATVFLQTGSTNPGFNRPMTGILIEQNILRRTSGGTYVLYVRNNGVNDPTGVSNGGFVRQGASDWIVNTRAWGGRPWGVRIKNNYIDSPVNAKATDVCSTTGTANDETPMVASEAAWKAGVAKQFNLSTVTDAAMLDSMMLGTFDWTNSQPAHNNTVLEARYTAHPTKQSWCDARCWVIWDTNKRFTEQTLIHPAGSAQTYRDANGYYLDPAA